MDYGACNVVYVDRSAGENLLIKRGEIVSEVLHSKREDLGQADGSDEWEARLVDRNVQTLLETFSEGMFRNKYDRNFWLTFHSPHLHERYSVCVEVSRIA